MPESKMKTPGVYINEVSAFPNSVVPVPTAIPAFVGYTPQAFYNGKSCANQAVSISSFREFQEIFCLPAPARQYAPQYYLVPQKVQPTDEDYLLINGQYYALLPDPNTIYYLYNSIRLFYQNGGGQAYIVSVGGYGPASGNPMQLGTQLVNPNVRLNDLLNGLKVLEGRKEPTMYICPEATLLSVAENGTLMQTMMTQSASMGASVSIFDVIGGRKPDPDHFMDDIALFRNNTGQNGLSYGTAYYPFIGTTMMQSSDIDYINLFGGDVKQLSPLLNPADEPNPAAELIINDIINPRDAMTVVQYNIALMNASQTYTQIMAHLLADVNILPPSGAMAGVITTIDNERGVWMAPANTSIVGAASLPIRLTDAQQANLNVDAVSGKSINAIRFFNGRGILVWGARTLDGNSQDWRYLPVRREMIYIEQSCKQAIQGFVFEPNNANTWAAVRGMLENFLTGLWREGGLQGSTAATAFAVECGLGTTMTADDILNGYMNVIINAAVVRPAEFIVIAIRQQMASAS